MKTNITTLTDSYKFTHWPMMPENCEALYSYFESRKGAKWDETVFFGLQYLIKEHLVGQVVTAEKIYKARLLALAHFNGIQNKQLVEYNTTDLPATITQTVACFPPAGGDEYTIEVEVLNPKAIFDLDRFVEENGITEQFNNVGWNYILTEYKGCLPVIIKAVPEGMVVPVSNILMSVVNVGGKKTAFLTNHLETVLSQIWYPCTVATLSRETKKVFKHYLDLTSDNPGGINFMLHDFSYRGVSSVESAGIGGLAHLVNFLGTDTVRAMEFAMEYYGANICNLAFSVPATEHSVMTPDGPEGESKIVGRLIKKYSKGILSIVIDSYDYKNFIKVIVGEDHKEEILARDGVTVFRPDSGDPEEVTLNVIHWLGEIFGFTYNNKGYRVLNPKIRVLWGDGIDKRGVENILGILMVNKWSAENMVFGMGGGLLQKVNRDDQRFAFKCAAQLRNNVWVGVSKNPIDKTKASKKGLLKLVRENGTVITVPDVPTDLRPDLLRVVFNCGFEENELIFDQIRLYAKLT